MLNYIFVTILTLFVFNIAVAEEEECSVMTEAEKFFQKMIDQYAPHKDQHLTYKKCLRAFFFCKPEECDRKNFKLPQAPICERLMRHDDFQDKVRGHCFITYDRMLENTLYSNGIEADEFCKNLPKDAEKISMIIRGTYERPDKASKLFHKYCHADPLKCEDLTDIPKELEDYIFNGVSTELRKFVDMFLKLLKKQGGKKGGSPVDVLAQTIELLLGGGSFGIEGAKCVREIYDLGTDFADQELDG